MPSLSNSAAPTGNKRFTEPIQTIIIFTEKNFKYPVKYTVNKMWYKLCVVMT